MSYFQRTDHRKDAPAIAVAATLVQIYLQNPT
jgi:hypothetical protein